MLIIMDVDNNGRPLRELDRIRERWKRDFYMLLNEENPSCVFGDGMPHEGLLPGISRNKVKSPHGDHMTRKDDKGDQPSGGETT